MVAVWIFVSYSSSLADRIWVHPVYADHAVLQISTVARVLAGDQQNSFVEATDHWDLRRSLLGLIFVGHCCR